MNYVAKIEMQMLPSQRTCWLIWIVVTHAIDEIYILYTRFR